MGEPLSICTGNIARHCSASMRSQSIDRPVHDLALYGKDNDDGDDDDADNGAIGGRECTCSALRGF
jgi:hypothetical protein